MSNSKEQERHLRELSFYEKQLEIENLDKATSNSTLAEIEDILLKYPTDLNLHLKTIILYERVYGTEHPITIFTYRHIAKMYDSLGDCQSAKEWYLNMTTD